MISKLGVFWMGVVVYLASASGSFAQSNVLTLAYQLTHVDQGEPYFSPDGKRVVYETTVAGYQQNLHHECRRNRSNADYPQFRDSRQPIVVA